MDAGMLTDLTNLSAGIFAASTPVYTGATVVVPLGNCSAMDGGSSEAKPEEGRSGTPHSAPLRATWRVIIDHNHRCLPAAI